MPPHSSTPPSGYATIVPKTLITGTPNSKSIAVPAHNYYEIILNLGLRDQTVVGPTGTFALTPRKSGVAQAGRINLINDAAGNALDLTVAAAYQDAGSTETAGKLGYTQFIVNNQNNAIPFKYIRGYSGGYAVKGLFLFGVIEDANPLDEFLVTLQAADLIANISWYQVIGINGSGV